MSILAMYIPIPEHLHASIALLAICFVILCTVSYRLRLSVVKSAVMMLLGAAIAIGPDFYSLSHLPNEYYASFPQEWMPKKYSDTFYAVTTYMYVGRGKLLCIAGMAAGLVIYAVTNACVKRFQATGICCGNVSSVDPAVGQH